jgi:hypothetical protein
MKSFLKERVSLLVEGCSLVVVVVITVDALDTVELMPIVDAYVATIMTLVFCKYQKLEF